MALLGPSGCGKTTLLRLVAGFEWPDSGTIAVNGHIVAGGSQRIPAEQRHVGMVFQEYALFPHLDVAGNIGFGLRGLAREKQDRIAEMLALVGLSELAHRMPHELSGGQQQRVALARALAPRPEILLLDEPFSNLDAALRGQVRTEVQAILKASGATCLFVTHDQQEALSLADEVAVMFDGQIVQVAPPQRLYLHPINQAVAAFVGEANFLPGQVDGTNVRCALGTLPVNTPHRAASGPVEVLIRPEAISLVRERDDTVGLSGEVLWREFYGHDQRIAVALENGAQIVARLDSSRSFAPGEVVSVRVAGPVQVFPPRC
jgi:iron(III) transport system ATP-binding protein